MFKAGDIVVVKVMNVVLNEGGKHRVTLSLDPHDIHDAWRATDLSEDIVSCCIYYVFENVFDVVVFYAHRL